METLVITPKGLQALEDYIDTDPNITLALMDLQVGRQPRPEFKQVLLQLNYANVVYQPILNLPK